MIAKSYADKRYTSAHKRTLHASIARFFEVNFPRSFGRDIRDLIAREIVGLVESQIRSTEQLQPGQCLWNAVSIETRADSDKMKLIPVVLTLVDDMDVTRLSAGESVSKVAQDAVARILREAYDQGGLLSMRDIGLLVWRDSSSVSYWRKRWEERNQQVLPHPGSLQDFGTCITHKTAIIVKAVYEKKDTRRVAQETKHSQRAVDRYLKDFHRVRTCYEHGSDIEFICQVTGMSNHLVKQYIEIIQKHEPAPLTRNAA